jgi:drug/metabolite transporter (DMT)-like permease
MNKKALRADLLLLLTSCIWGFAFVAQRSGMEYLGPLSFNAIRFLLGSASLLPLILFRQGRRGKNPRPAAAGIGPLVRGSLGAGSCLFIAASLQQVGILFTTAGNSGFITGLYVVLVPVFGLWAGKKTGLPTWIGAGFTLGGLFFLSVAGKGGTINRGDLITAVSALFWTFHVLLIDRLAQKLDPIELSSGQFFFCGLFSLLAALLFRESFEFSRALEGAVPLLYGGLGSVGVAYTLQVVAQRDAPPAHAAIILCLEGSFAAAGGALILAEPLGPGTLLGFALMLTGMLITQGELITGGRKT